MSTITAIDFEKGATYAHKEKLKEIGFRWNKDAKKWQKDGELNARQVYDLISIGIKIDLPVDDTMLGLLWEEHYLHVDGLDFEQPKYNPGQFYGKDDDSTPKIIKNDDKVDAMNSPAPVDEIEFFTHQYPDIDFNHGAFLHSRANSGKPVDEWYKKKLVQETPTAAVKFLIGNFYPRAKYIILSIQDNNYNDKKYTNAWIFPVDGNDVIIDKAKLRVDKKREK